MAGAGALRSARVRLDEARSALQQDAKPNAARAWLKMSLAEWAAQNRERVETHNMRIAEIVTRQTP